MNTAYWDLFWTTGMPEAWLMSRDRVGAAASASGPEAGCAKGVDASMEAARLDLTGGASAASQG